MSSRISYMGTKHDLADRVAEVIATCRPGRLLDAFAGMGAVADVHAGRRQIWTNDVQHFAYIAARCRFTDPEGPIAPERMRQMAEPIYRGNLDSLREQNAALWQASEALPTAGPFEEFHKHFECIANLPIGSDDAYSCFTRTYANTYFSLIQCAEIDSIRCALDTLRGRGLLTLQQFEWGLLGLGHAALRLANTTGHFAQFLKPSATNYRRVARQFARSIIAQWFLSLGSIKPSGTSEWRQGNIASRSECDSLLRTIPTTNDLGVVYCDPPYTNDQYSRFYHLWETLVLYDYPEVSGRGLYRPKRFTTNFSLRTKVVEAFKNLVTEVAATGADLVLSYPSNGLLHDVGASPLEVLKVTYPNARLFAEIEHSHSTMGASKGSASAVVAECIYLAQA